ncbi:MAG: RICIN domain-containing protein [Clostridia bacterium]|nr:RICIN domain-containing protein [Clostridia bacterium]
MKKFLLLVLVFMLIISSVPVYAGTDYITVIIDGEELVPKDVNGNIVRPMLTKGTTYLPVRAVASALNLDIEWDDATKSVFINGTPEKAEKTDVVNVYINGEKILPMDVNGNVVNPILKDGTTYLPIRAISEAFNKEVSWEQETHTVILTTPPVKSFEEGKTYAFVNKASGKAISLTDKGLETEKFYHYDFQGFKITASDADGYYYITSTVNDKNFDVNGNSKNPGATIITYNPGTADNQKFKIENTEDGYIIYALSSLLPIEDSAGVVKQNEKRDSLVQKWDIKEMIFTREKRGNNSCILVGNNGAALYDYADGLFYGYVDDGTPGAISWLLTPNADGEYIITNVNTGKSLDVANNSKTSGDPIITYATSGDANQRWTFEKQEDGTYLIKSVHSGLYLSISSDGTVVQAELNESLKQNWKISVY